MISLSGLDGRQLLLHPDSIRMVEQAGASQAWHGCRANVKTEDGKWVEVRETPEAILEAIERATATDSD